MPNYMELLTTASYILLEDEAGLDFTADVEMRFDVQNDDWFNGSADQYMYSRFTFAGDHTNLRCRFQAATNFRVQLSTSLGQPGFQSVHDLSGTIVDGERAQFRFTVDADNGATEKEIEVFTRLGANIQDLESDADWTSHGAQTEAGVQVWKNVTSDALFGRTDANQFLGRLYRMVGWRDLTKTAKFVDLDFRDPRNQTTPRLPTEWDDGAAVNTWDLQGVRDTDWRYAEIARNVHRRGLFRRPLVRGSLAVE